MSPICELNNISKKFKDRTVLSDFSLQVEQGELLAITGESGSGKTTILNIIGLLEKQDGGTLSLFGYKNPTLQSKEGRLILRKKISYLFQNYALIDNETVDQNLDLAFLTLKCSKEKKKELKLEALDKVGLKVNLKQYVFSLSGGEQQRLAIARLLIKPCDLVLADEPTGSLDSNNRNEILSLLKELNQQRKTIIIVTHDDYVASSCNNVLQLD
ncbi:putative bacteriocin export ABC transporter [Shouchella patagoniensis]|uniref:putative bacteriocin export ABC transporter n=1 Tax=Shouchella patagoniensis TaxID=228576 RepID=UPI00099509C7|nr:putative bacteriocin export ABC transporter [Shouchella patagoniensis]